MRQTLFIITAALMLGGCSLFEGSGDEVIFDDAIGPNTEAQSRTLPNDLRGDTDKRNHTPKRVGKDLDKDKPA